MPSPLVAVIRWCKLSRRCTVRKYPRRWHFASAARAAAILLQQAPSITTGRNKWPTTWKGSCSRSAIVGYCAHAGSARIPTTGPVTRYWRIILKRGSIDGVDVAGRTIAMVSHIPGNVLQGNFRVALYVDESASQSQQEAILNVYSGKLGGPIA